MEVFMRNVLPRLTDRSLETQLQPLMERLHITDYMVEKAKGKHIGNITFRHKADGVRFLQHHREITILGSRVVCQESKRAVNELTLRAIEHKASQRIQNETVPQETVKTLAATELSCGYYTFNDKRLTFTAEWTANESCQLKFTKRNLLVRLTGRDVQLRMPFQSIIELVWWHDGTVAVTLSWAPTILAPKSTGNDDITTRFSMFTIRQQTPERMRQVAIDQNHQRIVATCLVYYFKVPNAITRHANSDFQSEISRMSSRQLFPVTRYHLGFEHARQVRFSDAAATLQSELAEYNRGDSLPFDLLFLLHALLANGYLHPATISALASRLVSRFAAAKKAESQQPPVSVDAFKKLFDWIDWPSPEGDPGMFEVDGIMEYLEQAEQLVRQSRAVKENQFDETPNRARIFRAVVTPTRVMFHGPELEPMNRILRKFPDHSYFIRAQFCDENGQDLFFNNTVSLDSIYERFKAVLVSGVMVAGRVYKLLGFSHSSLRAHSAWLSASFVHQGQLHIPEYIVTGLGDFEKIKSPARRAARIGQAFSETPYAVDLDENAIEVREIPDIERNGRVFTDGSGKISPGAAKAIYNVIPKSKGCPTCFQIRWAGAKGMLAVDPRLVGNLICIRPSMIKFPSNDKQLEICDMGSKPIPMVLNRPLIKIMEDMGAPREWFLELQSREVRRLQGLTASVYNTASFLRAQRIGESIQLHKFLRQTEAMGLDYRQDGFLRGAVEAILLQELRLLKHKSRIPVRKGMTLFGVPDETGYLKEGQVYVTFDKGDRHSEPPGSGPVIVTRSPAMHPGDVRVAYNTIPPNEHPLVHYRNCIVFSTWGSRDLPSQLAGGDLDGDTFHIIWDPELVGRVKTFSPANYPRVEPLELNRPVTSSDLATFFFDFMRQDCLGRISTRHMILADQRPAGTLHADCIKLAELHSSAVDFSKTGRPVSVRDLPRSEKWRPDFLAPGPQITIHNKSDVEVLNQHVAPQNDEDDEDNDEGPRYQYYRSPKLLGQLYRAVDENKIWAEDIKMAIRAGSASFWDQLLDAIHQRVSAIGPVEWQHRSAEAHRIRYAYEEDIHGTMIDGADHPHQPLRELEVFVGFIMNKSGVQTHRQRDRSVKLKDEFERITTYIAREMRNPASVSGYTSELDALELCLACLHVACQKKEEDRDLRPRHRSSAHNLESFKIVAAATLLRELTALERGTVSGAGQAYAYGGGGRPSK
ncbi:RNA dependent RNA polymerase-domain-containing protein [Chaetomium strumarium]|uniref:RNA-dependent RNA polymerase n=1 Tax=Chaetomium strumarium TaxID=1170767 RepID=A0AAJ0GPU3_9PEZI|nr:RNA dependent RNA polymerase-domain-containing protein [Chaetomium strumarium]